MNNINEQAIVKTASKQLKNIETSDDFKKLNEITRQFNIFDFMGVQDKELVHSRILSNLLNPKYPHGLGNAFLSNFLFAIKKSHCFSGKPISIPANLAEQDVRIKREYENIDIVVRFPIAKVTIGIENKIWAGEQNNQLSRYQSTLKEKFESSSNAIVFLTPEGRDPSTAEKPEKESPGIYCMSYDQIVQIVKESKGTASSSSFFLDQFTSHLENHMNGNVEIKEKCWELFENYEQAYKFMAKNYEYCKWRKILKWFEEFKKKLKSDERFIPWEKVLVFEKANNGCDEKKLHYAINIRSKNWPDKIYLLIYKHYWLGIYPYTSDPKIAERFIAMREIAKDWGYFFSNDSSLSNQSALGNYRCIQENGDSLTLDNIEEALNRAKMFLDGIEEILREKGWTG